MLVETGIGIDPQAGPGSVNARAGEPSNFDTIIDGLLGKKPPPAGGGAGSNMDDAGVGGYSSPPPKVQDPGKVEFYKGLSGKSGAQIVAEMEKNGALVFQGNNSGKLREALIANLDGSKFFKNQFLDGFTRNVDLKITYSIEKLPSGAAGLAGGDGHGGSKISLDENGLNNGLNTRFIIAHETLHASASFKDAADMDVGMAIFSKEIGKPEPGKPDHRSLAGSNYDYELFEATRVDWVQSGALRQEDYYNYDTPGMKDAMEGLYGPEGRNRDPRQAFSDSAQRYDGDGGKIALAYLNAKDGGKVQEIRARQLRELGIDPASIKNNAEVGRNKESLLNGLVSEYHNTFMADGGKYLRNRTVPLTEQLEKNYAGLMQFYKVFIDPKATDQQAANWVMNQVQSRLPGVFPDGKGTTIVGKHDNGTYANDILTGWYNKGGLQYIIDSHRKNFPNNSGKEAA